VGNLNLTSILALDPPALKWRWRAMMPQIPGSSYLIAGNYALVEAITFPHTRISPVGRFVAGTRRYYPDFSDVDPISVMLYEDENYNATKYIYAWRNLIKNGEDNYFPANNYKKAIELKLYSAEDDNTELLTFKANGVWPSDISAFDYSYTEDNRMTVQVMFSIDTDRLGLEVAGQKVPEGSGGIQGLIQRGIETLVTRGVSELRDRAAGAIRDRAQEIVTRAFGI